MSHLSYILTLACLVYPYFYGVIHAQSDEDLIDIYHTVEIDSIVVVASKSGFSIEDFIDLAVRDTSFYTAFHNLRTAAYPFQTQVKFYDRKNRVRAQYENKAHQQIDDAGCRSMKLIEEHEEGSIKKGDSYKYFTMKMFAKAFFTEGTVCDTDKTAIKNTKHKKSTRDKYYGELKKLLFFPAQEVHVPMMGQRTQIYSSQMRPYYNYSIQSERHKSGQSCYTFTAEVKPKFRKLNQNKNTVIKKLKLYFSRHDFQVMGKEYLLEFNSGLYKFSTNMDIQLDRVQNLYYPVHIIYDGYWKVPFKRKEKSRFEMQIGPKIVAHER